MRDWSGRKSSLRHFAHLSPKFRDVKKGQILESKAKSLAFITNTKAKDLSFRVKAKANAKD